VTNGDPESALIIEVPEAEPAVARHRTRLDASAALGVPAHITVLAPFLPRAAIGPDVLAELTRLFAAVRPFRFRLDRTAWFGDEVLWLGPAEPGPFRELTALVYASFPACPPFGGEFEDVVPHLTVGHAAPLADLRAAERAVRAALPVAGHATAVTLLTRGAADGRWARAATLALT
jgi:2'-5' RNA ligase